MERRGWLTPEDFTETLSLCQSLPGPNVVNMSIVVGARACGWRGSIAAFAGLIGAPVLIVIALGMLYSRFGGLREVQRALVGLAAAASGLVRRDRRAHGRAAAEAGRGSAAPFIAAAFAGVAILRLPLPLGDAGAGPDQHRRPAVAAAAR